MGSKKTNQESRSYHSVAATIDAMDAKALFV